MTVEELDWVDSVKCEWMGQMLSMIKAILLELILDENVTGPSLNRVIYEF